jgi:uncharacterized protein (DUF952 family)/quercetin dioxygenase-like cupin family protein
MSVVQATASVRVLNLDTISIDEFFGHASAGGDISVAQCTVKSASEEAWQKPTFDEFVVVLEGEVSVYVSETAANVEADDVAIVVAEAGQALRLPRNVRHKWVWTGPCKYLAICLPAFSPENCGREEDEEGSEAMSALRRAHRATSSEHPWIYHAAQRDLWEAARSKGEPYFPPTYATDGFTHGTADPSKILTILNWFYKHTKGDWVCLRMSEASLREHGITTIFEPAAPVGDSDAHPQEGGDEKRQQELFPHVYGGIPPSAVLEEYFVVRSSSDGSFLSIPGVSPVSRKFTSKQSFLHGLLWGIVMSSSVGCLLVAFLKHKR